MDFDARCMALLITDQCINCDVCEPVCPNQAIYPGHKLYHITPARCTECVGHFDVPQCVEVCPVECIFVDTALAESKADLTLKYQQLTQDNNSEAPPEIRADAFAK